MNLKVAQVRLACVVPIVIAAFLGGCIPGHVATLINRRTSAIIVTAKNYNDGTPERRYTVLPGDGIRLRLLHMQIAAETTRGETIFSKSVPEDMPQLIGSDSSEAFFQVGQDGLQLIDKPAAKTILESMQPLHRVMQEEFSR